MTAAARTSGRPLVGIFVGGASRRMGGAPKGLLLAPDAGVALVARAAALAARVGCDAVLVGAAGAYAHLGLAAIDDAPAGVGPLGGLRALLARAGARGALALACDMPFVTERLLARLVVERPDAPALAPRVAGRWEPLCARYGAACAAVVDARLAAGRHGLQGVLDEAGAVELPLDEAETSALRDWDTPEDVARDRTPGG